MTVRPLRDALSVWFSLATVYLSASAALAQTAPTAPPQDVAVYDRAAARVRHAYRDVDAGVCRQLPIGLFDSGTGGLTVLEQILCLDSFDNTTHAPRAGGDGRPDFELERFVFLGDQANMPYGQYASVGKAEFLRELVLKDAEFLLLASRSGARGGVPNAEDEQGCRAGCKSIVIACNTATAHGEHLIRRLLQEAAAPVSLLGVIEAGAEGALESLPADKGGTVGVLATCGTVESKAYPAAIQRLAQARGLNTPVRVVQQGSVGLAGAIDGVAEFILPAATEPRGEYRGPAIGNRQAPIVREQLPRMAFEFSSGRMLCEGDPRDPARLQINSVGNYIAYDVTMLLESLRQVESAQPLQVVILGCTHFPFFAEVFRQQLRRLYDYQEQGRFLYRPFMAREIAIVDPAQFAAKQLYRRLARENRLCTSASQRPLRAQFFISVPNPAHPGTVLTDGGWFAHDYKYGRQPGLDGADVLRAPLTPDRVGRPAWERLRREVPHTLDLMERFGRASSS